MINLSRSSKIQVNGRGNESYALDEIRARTKMKLVDLIKLAKNQVSIIPKKQFIPFSTFTPLTPRMVVENYSLILQIQQTKNAVPISIKIENSFG